MVSWRLRLFWATLLGVGAALASFMYLRSVAPAVDVVVAQVTIPARSVISTEQLAVRTVSRRDAALLVNRPVGSPAQAVGAVAVQEIPAGQPLQDSPRFLQRSLQAQAAGTARLSYFLPDDARAYTISVDEAALVGGQVHESDRVDVIFTSKGNATGGVYATALVEGATVLRLQRVTGTQTGQYLVTLLVTPAQALALSLGKHEGSLDLALASPGAPAANLAPLSPLQFLKSPQHRTSRDDD